MAEKWIPWSERKDVPELFVYIKGELIVGCIPEGFVPFEYIYKIGRIQSNDNSIKRSVVSAIDKILFPDEGYIVEAVEFLSFSELTLEQKKIYADCVFDLENKKDCTEIKIINSVLESIRRMERTEEILFNESQLESAPADDGSVEADSAPAVPVADVVTVPAVSSESAPVPAPADSKQGKAKSKQQTKETGKREKATGEQVLKAMELLVKYFKSNNTDYQPKTVKNYLNEQMGLKLNWDLSVDSKLGCLYGLLYYKYSEKLPRKWTMGTIKKAKETLNLSGYDNGI